MRRWRRSFRVLRRRPGAPGREPQSAQRGRLRCPTRRAAPEQGRHGRGRDVRQSGAIGRGGIRTGGRRRSELRGGSRDGLRGESGFGPVQRPCRHVAARGRVRIGTPTALVLPGIAHRRRCGGPAGQLREGGGRRRLSRSAGQLPHHTGGRLGRFEGEGLRGSFHRALGARCPGRAVGTGRQPPVRQRRRHRRAQLGPGHVEPLPGKGSERGLRVLLGTLAGCRAPLARDRGGAGRVEPARVTLGPVVEAVDIPPDLVRARRLALSRQREHQQTVRAGPRQ